MTMHPLTQERLEELAESARRRNADLDASLCSDQGTPLIEALLISSCTRYAAYLVALGCADDARLAFHQSASMALASAKRKGEPLRSAMHRTYLSALLSDNPTLIDAYVARGQTEAWEEEDWLGRSVVAALRGDRAAIGPQASAAESAVPRVEAAVADSDDSPSRLGWVTASRRR